MEKWENNINVKLDILSMGDAQDGKLTNKLTQIKLVWEIIKNFIDEPSLTVTRVDPITKVSTPIVSYEDAVKAVLNLNFVRVKTSIGKLADLLNKLNLHWLELVDQSSGSTRYNDGEIIDINNG